MVRLINILFLSALLIKAYSQESVSFRYSDSLTYKLYEEKNWSELIKKGKEAIDNGHDYFYMRMRLGIAYYERRNYGMAAIHFSKALTYNEKDQIALEYLYYSFYLSGRNLQAWTLLPELNSMNSERIIKESKFRKNMITSETYYNDADSEVIISNPDEYFSNPEGGSQSVTKNFINNAIYASHIFGKRFSYFHSFTSLIKNNYLHYFDGLVESDLPRQRVVQNQYYGRFSYFTKSGLVISPAFHFLTAGYPFISISYTPINYSSSTYNLRTNGFAGSLAVTKTGGFSTISGEAVYSKLNNVKQLQGTVSLIAYPAGNQNVYFGGKITFITFPEMTSSENHFIPEIIAGFAVRRRIWFEFSGLSGNMKNYTENNGLIVFNSMDFLTEKYNGKIIIPLYKAGLTFYAGAGGSKSTSEYTPFDGINSGDPNKLIYKNYSIIGGISWHF